MKQYRIKLFSHADTLCQNLAVLAAKHNGGAADYSLEFLAHTVYSEGAIYPALYGGHKAEIIGDRLLHVDFEKGGEWVTGISIEEVEIFELPDPDIIEEGAGYGALAE